MSLVLGRVGGLRSRPFKLVLASALACVLPALAADAASATTARMTPSIQGFGSLSGPSYNCTSNNRDDRVAVGCDAVQVVNNGGFLDPFPTAALAITAAASSAPGNSFAGWQGCSVPPFTFFSSASAVGNTCTLSVGAFDGSLTISPRAVFNDSAGPTVNTITPVRSTTTDRGFSFDLGLNEPASSVECSVDSGAFAPCGTVRQFTEGGHSLRARATDASGNLGLLSALPATTFRVVDTTLTSVAPTAFSNVKRPTFTYSSVAGLRFECRLFNTGLPAPAFTSCGSKVAPVVPATFTPAADLTDGPKTFQVRAVDGPDVDGVPLTHNWTVDTVAPNVINLASPTITDGVVTTALTAAFTFATSEAPASFNRFECKLDSGDFAPCSSGIAFSDLPFGGRTFTVRARDKADNVGPEVSRSWTVAAQDNDGDGFNQRSDCNDANAVINPIAPDIPDNGVDENCDGIDAVNLDRDGDGFQRPGDCNDSNAGIRPGIPDIPDNNIDENCDGADTKTPPPPPLPTIASTVTFNFPSAGKKFTKFVRFQVKNLPTGSTVAATCNKCGKKAPKQTIKNAKGTVTLKKFQRKFKVGSVIQVRITKSGMIGIVKSVKILKRKNPVITTQCLPPGAGRPVKCA
jgi:hypothetical protein